MSMQITAVPSISESQTTTSRAPDAGLPPVTGVPFAARVGGKTYAADVQPSPVGGEYFGSVPNLFGASTEGATVDDVEKNLGNLIDFFA